MGRPKNPDPGALIVGIMYRKPEILEQATDALVKRFGPVTLAGDAFAFDMSDYYVPEMGSGIMKRFVCFSRPIALDMLPEIKLVTNSVEEQFGIMNTGVFYRLVNIDPGYVTLAKLVLASTKDYSHRVYLSRGIYGETMLRFVGTSFVPLDTTYPDYRTPSALAFFN